MKSLALFFSSVVVKYEFAALERLGLPVKAQA
jgi:hypothetical protein